jgi:hypothetical protein
MVRTHSLIWLIGLAACAADPQSNIEPRSHLAVFLREEGTFEGRATFGFLGRPAQLRPGPERGGNIDFRRLHPLESSGSEPAVGEAGDRNHGSEEGDSTIVEHEYQRGGLRLREEPSVAACAYTARDYRIIGGHDCRCRIDGA